jgi:TonB family protein
MLKRAMAWSLRMPACLEQSTYRMNATMRFLLAPLLLLAGPAAVQAQYIFGHGAQFSDGPARSEVEAEFTYIDVEPPCEISMIIGVDRKGKVVSVEAEQGPAWCADTTVLAKAIRSVRARVFNAAPDAPKVQRGRVHWSYHQPETDIIDVVAMPDEVEEDDQVHERAEVEQAPIFPGGDAALDKYIRMNLRYPDDAMTAKKEGVVLISFIVEKDGKLSTFTLEKGVETSLNQEAMRVMLRMPLWLPGMHNGRQVRTRCELPITFRIQ